MVVFFPCSNEGWFVRDLLKSNVVRGKLFKTIVANHT